MLYILFDNTTSADLSIETPLILGMTIRLAMRMGIHRNSKAHPGLTPYQDEMRCRLWATILMADVLHSFQLSLPAMISQGDWNCAMPRNIRNDEFVPQSIRLPPQRPLSEHTEVTYMILKSRLLLVLKDIMILTNHTNRMSEEDMRRCESSLAEAHSMIPAFLHVIPVEQLDLSSATIVKHRISFDRVYQLCRCMLYRRFLRQGHTDSAVTSYRLSCIDAALKLLRHQATLFIDIENMFLPSMKRRHRIFEPTSDFFVAGMVIALDLYFDLELKSKFPTQAQEYNPDSMEMFVALENSNRYWEMTKYESVEAAKAYGIFSFVLQKVRKHRSETGSALCTTNLEFSNIPLAALESTLEFDWVS